MWNDFKGKCICYVCVAQSCLTVCKPTDCSPPGSSVHGIFQARILEGVAMPSSRGSSWPRNQTCVSCIGRQILYHYATREAPYLLSEVEWSEIAQSCPTLCDPMDCSLPGSSIQGIFQARGLEEGAICSIKSYHKMMAIITAPSSISLCLIYFTHSSLCLLILSLNLLSFPSPLWLPLACFLRLRTCFCFALYIHSHYFLD